MTSEMREQELHEANLAFIHAQTEVQSAQAALIHAQTAQVEALTMREQNRG